MDCELNLIFRRTYRGTSGNGIPGIFKLKVHYLVLFLRQIDRETAV